MAMILATSYPFLEVFWTMLIFFAFVVWIWILITVFADLFRRHDTSGFAKVLWIIFIIVLPYLGVFIYLIAEHKGMTERAVKQQTEAKAQFDQYVQSVATQSDPTEQIAKAKQMLDSGAITQTEFEQIKRKALASPA
jgi:high-affinity K+ transport system ATPase subunit B